MGVCLFFELTVTIHESHELVELALADVFDQVHLFQPNSELASTKHPIAVLIHRVEDLTDVRLARFNGTLHLIGEFAGDGSRSESVAELLIVDRVVWLVSTNHARNTDTQTHRHTDTQTHRHRQSLIRGACHIQKHRNSMGAADWTTITTTSRGAPPSTSRMGIIALT